MDKEIKQRQAVILSKYPVIENGFKSLCATRYAEIIDELLKSDTDYQMLTQQRAETSQAVLKILSGHGMADHFEAYSDAVYAEEVYELSVIYKEAFLDALELMERLELL